jgi:hypothetical protein
MNVGEKEEEAEEKEDGEMEEGGVGGDWKREVEGGSKLRIKPECFFCILI